MRGGSSSAQLKIEDDDQENIYVDFFGLCEKSLLFVIFPIHRVLLLNYRQAVQIFYETNELANAIILGFLRRSSYFLN
jgi:hypothetical protein